MEMKQIARFLIGRYWNDRHKINMIELFAIRNCQRMNFYWRYSGETECYKTGDSLNFLDTPKLKEWCKSNDWELLGVEFLI